MPHRLVISDPDTSGVRTGLLLLLLRWWWWLSLLSSSSSLVVLLPCCSLARSRWFVASKLEAEDSAAGQPGVSGGQRGVRAPLPGGLIDQHTCDDVTFPC